MKILVYEYLTGGGMEGEPLPPDLAAEGELMARALVADLAELDGVAVLASRDDRLPSLPDPARTVRGLRADAERHWADALAACDAAWIVAPESDGLLETLCRRVEASRTPLVGPPGDVIELCSSKSATLRRLAGAGLPCVPTFADPVLPPLPGAWLVKPNDRCACEGLRRMPDATAARAWLQRHPPHAWIAQPWMSGMAASLSVVVAPDGRVHVLSLNEQHLTISGDGISLAGLTVGLQSPPGGDFLPLARDVVAAIPGLRGYFGVDLILTDDGPMILEINPRLTTAWAGLRRATGVNPAAIVLGLPSPPARRTPAPVHLNLQHAASQPQAESTRGA